MNNFFNYYNLLCSAANSSVNFSYDPFISAIKKMLVRELRQVVYYIEKLKELNVDMSLYTDKVIDFISVIIVNLDFNKDNFFVILQDLSDNKKNLKEMYIKISNEMSVSVELIDDDDIDYSSKDEILKILNDYEKNIKVPQINLDKEIKSLYEIMIILVLNSCNCLIELKNYGKNFETAKDNVLKLLNTANIPSATKVDWVETIKKFAQCNYKIVRHLYQTILEKYGPVIKKDICYCEKKGKSILVSGNSFQDLEKILEAAKDFDINIYTHNEMLSAHQYEKFSKYKNLAGHYQKTVNNLPLDFASFPGPIYISGNLIPKIDIIRGQIYTSGKYPAFAAGKIENEDFSPIIKYALDSKGFDSDNYINKINIGYNQKEIEEKLSEIINLYRKNTIKNIYIIGLIDRFNKQNKYIYDFFNKCPNDSYIISFSYDSDRQNFWHANSYFDFELLYKIIELLCNNIGLINSKINIFFMDCTASVISHIFNLIYLNINKIFLGPCCPAAVNPVLLEGLYKTFNINPVSAPIDDISICS